MKPSLFLLCSLALLSAVFGQEPSTLSPWNVRVELQIVTMPEEAALPLITELRDPNKIEAASVRLQEMIRSKQATLIGWPILTTQSGQKAVTETIDEIRRPVDEPAKTEKPDLNVDAGSGKTESQFEVRNTGVTLEIDPAVLEEGKFIQLSVVPQYVGLKAAGKGVLEEPGFKTTKTTTTLRLHNGEQILLAVHKTAPDEVQIQILRAEASR